MATLVRMVKEKSHCALLVQVGHLNALELRLISLKVENNSTKVKGSSKLDSPCTMLPRLSEPIGLKSKLNTKTTLP